MSITVATIHRYPVKGLREEPLTAVALTAGQGVPGDRRFAIARGDTPVDGVESRWQPKQRFVMLMRDTALARVGCRLDDAAGTITIAAPEQAACTATFATPAGREQLAGYVNAILGSRREGIAHWVESGAASFTDVPQNCLSLVNLASVRELEARMGRPMDPQRFRANIYLEGAAPWVEFDWVGSEVQVGAVRLRIPARIPRCAATGVDPSSGERDLNVLKGLQSAYGHVDMGIYAEVIAGGRIARGDALVPPAAPRSRSRFGHWLRFLRFVAASVPTVIRQRWQRPPRR